MANLLFGCGPVKGDNIDHLLVRLSIPKSRERLMPSGRVGLDLVEIKSWVESTCSFIMTIGNTCKVQ